MANRKISTTYMTKGSGHILIYKELIQVKKRDKYSNKNKDTYFVMHRNVKSQSCAPGTNTVF